MEILTMLVMYRDKNTFFPNILALGWGLPSANTNLIHTEAPWGERTYIGHADTHIMGDSSKFTKSENLPVKHFTYKYSIKY